MSAIPYKIMSVISVYRGSGFLICLFFISALLDAQSGLIISTESYSTSNGLSDNYVTSVVQDHKGFLWVGTRAGLNRFDGYSFLPVKPAKDNFNYFPEDIIYDLLSHNENLWICSQSGFCRYNLKTGAFYKNNFPEEYMNDMSASFTRIYPGRDSLFWLVSDTIILLAGPGLTKRSDILVYKEVILKDTGSIRINDLYQGVFNELWVGTSTSLHSLLISNDSIAQYLTEKSIYLNEPVEKIKPIDDHNIWIIHSENKISKINIHQRTLFALRNLQKGFLPNTKILDIEADNLGGIWIVNSDAGIHRYDLKTSLYTDHLFDRLDKIENLYENFINRLFKDRSGCIWACTRGGLAKITITESSFTVFSGFEKNVHMEPPGDVSTVCLDSSGFVWVTHWLDGPYRFQIKEDKFIDVTPEVLKKQNINLLFQRIPGVFIPRKHNIWFCTLNGNGILEYYFDGNEEKFSKQYKIKDGLPSDSINLAFRDSRNNIWIGTTRGIALFDPDTKTFNSQINNSSAIFNFNHHILAIEQTKDILWFGTLDGSLIRYKLPDKFIDKANPKIFEILENWIMSIKQSGDSVLWLGTMSGLYKYIIYNDQFEKIIKENESYSSVAEIQIGKDGNLWLGTLTGLVRVNPITLESHNFYAGNGVRINHINWRSSAQDSAGIIFFGTKAGLIYFDPEKVTKYTILPELVISRFSVENTQWPIEQYTSDDGKFDYSIVLPYNKNNLTIEFNALSYINQDKNQYMYRLSGLNEIWNTADYRGRLINYSNLSPGNYIFEFKASNYEGIWTQKPLRINIQIKQVIWKSKLAILFYLLFLSAITYLIILETRIRKRFREDLMREKLERKNFEEINELKLRFFTNITHEFRSPLTMIINPIDKLINNEFRPAMKKELHRIKENANRVLSLINQILDFRKVTSKGVIPYFKLGDINLFISKQIEAYSGANQNIQQLIFRSELSDSNFVFDSFILEKIVSNLISNAIKFSPDNTEIVITLKPATDENKTEGIILSVKDKGKGIPEQYLDKVFERFFQVGPENSGSGIGLSLVHELVTTHKGKISVESELNHGSCFRVFLPKIPLDGEMVENVSNNIVLKSFKALNSFVNESKSKVSSAGTFQAIAKYKILFIDDDEELLSYLVEEFDSVYTIYQASNGKDAWELIHHIHLDIIICDVNMPEMNGWELCNAIKTDLNYSHIPVILLTVDNSDESREQGYECGADSYLGKPISLSILHTRIQNILRTREKARIKYQKSLSLEPGEVITTSMDEQFLKKALHIVEENIDNPDFNNDSFCQELGVSSTQLYKKLKSLLGLSASEFIKDIRLKRAAQLLKMNGNNISEVAYMCGFADPKYFSKCFKKQFGVNPKRFPKQYDKAIPT